MLLQLLHSFVGLLFHFPITFAMGAIIKTASALLSLAVLTSAKPVLRRQDATPTEPAAAAETSDINTTINITYVSNDNTRT